MPKSVFTFTSEIYFDELDALWVLHHARYLHHLERAQQAFFQHLLGVPDFNAPRDEDIYVVVRNIRIDYRMPIRQPGPIAVHYTIDRVRAAGVEMDFRITTPDSTGTFAQGNRTVCKLSGLTHQPTNWTPNFLAALERWAQA